MKIEENKNKELPIKINVPNGFLDEEVRCGYTVSSKMKAVWAVEIDLYIELKRVCDKYNLSLYADGGTMLGAVRHSGFIPWDDDMDFAMSREDYKKLCEVANREFNYPYFWLTEETDPGTAFGHGQLRNSKTTGFVEGGEVYGKNHGIFIDVFPFDNVPNEESERKQFLVEIVNINEKRKRYRDYLLGLNYSDGFVRMIKGIYLIAFGLFHRNGRNKYYDLLELKKKQYNSVDTNLWGNLQMLSSEKLERSIFKKEYYTKSIEVDFEFISLKIPYMYEDYLAHLYGDWKKYVIGTSDHGNTFLDPYKSYIEYEKTK